MLQDLFTRVFPVPKLLSMQGGGLEISDASLKYFRFDTKNGVRRVASFGEVPLPSGAISGGEVRDTQALRLALANVRERCGFSFVHASLPEQKGYLFDMALGAGDNAREQAELALPEHVPFSPAEVVFDCDVVSGGGPSLVVTVFPEAAAQVYADALTAADFIPLSFELEPQAAARAIVREPTPGAQLLIDYGAAKTVLSVVQAGAVRFTTSTEGTATLDQALRAKFAELPPEEQEAHIDAIKNEQGFATDSPDVALFSAAASALTSAVNRVLIYWQSRSSGEGHERIGSIILYGGNATTRWLPEFLSQASGLPASLADLGPALGVFSEVPPLPRERSFRYATAVGLALRSGSPTL